MAPHKLTSQENDTILGTGQANAVNLQDLSRGVYPLREGTVQEKR